MMKILITYASAHGTTQSIAERIESRMAATNIGVVTILPMDKNPHLGDYGVLIVGSSIHAGSWLSPATRFLKFSTGFLKEQPKPTWAFSVGMLKEGAPARREEEKMEKWLRGCIDIRGHILFQGRWQQDLPWGFNWLFHVAVRSSKIEETGRRLTKWTDGIVHELITDPPCLTGRQY